MCNDTVLIILLRYGIGFVLFWTWGHTFVYTSELPLSSRYMRYGIERKVRSMGFSEAVNLPQYGNPLGPCPLPNLLLPN